MAELAPYKNYNDLPLLRDAIKMVDAQNPEAVIHSDIM